MAGICIRNNSQVLNPLRSARQRPSYGDCLEVKREYYQNCCVLAAHLQEQFLQVQQIALVTLDPCAVHRCRCLELYYCNMVVLMGFKPDLDDQLVSFSALTLLV